MGSTFQCMIGMNALRQVGIPIHLTDNPALNVFHLEKIRKSFAAADADPQKYYIAKAHPAFPQQVEAVMTAENIRVFLVWRDQEDALVSDFHFSQRRGGHHYKNFDDYFRRRGRKILLRNCLQQKVWSSIKDERVRAWEYLDLVDNFEQAAGELIEFAGLRNVDIAELKKSVSIEELRRTQGDPEGTFFRQGGKQDIGRLTPNQETLATIEEIISEDRIERLGQAFEYEDWRRIVLFGRESREAGVRKTFHWWLYHTQRAQLLRDKVLPRVYKFSPRRIL